jgi:hypothetical protein
MKSELTRYIGNKDKATNLFKYLLSKARKASVEQPCCILKKKVRIKIEVEEVNEG